ncbi:hypothetical protein [Klebsiella pneumoniae]|uniref:hypothetical protein n=1 Tax=Klebsiella pneumoniae TaxID=573 RepID=UPI0007CD1154|nr:hypothetical protein [Klebsiella pneumoniae]OKN53021.1 hypothetical protein AM421_002827 [Klebsiella pneumoniae]SAT95933.1 Uncharacterised protein [Klebsiella pneumoniae]
MNVYEMEGFLRGKCLPGDLKVNESNAEYLVRKLNAVSELKGELTAALATIEKCREVSGCPAGVDLHDHLRQLAAENVALKAEQVRIFNSGYLRGHESTVEGYYVDIHQDDITTYHEDVVAEISEEQTPATDRIVAGIKADGVEEWVSSRGGRWNGTTEEALKFAKQLREGADK